MRSNESSFSGTPGNRAGGWKVPEKSVAFDETGIRSRLLALEHPCYAAHDGKRSLHVTLAGSGISSPVPVIDDRLREWREACCENWD